MAKKAKKTGKYDIFLSYRRDGGEAMAILLCDRLKAKGYRVFLDVENLNIGDFDEQLLRVIDGCKDVAVVLSKDSLERCRNEGDWLRTEVAYALDKGKNVIPVMMRGFEWPEILPDDIAGLPKKSGVSAASNEYFDFVVERLTNKYLISKPRKRSFAKAVTAAVISVVVLAAAGAAAWYGGLINPGLLFGTADSGHGNDAMIDSGDGDEGVSDSAADEQPVTNYAPVPLSNDAVSNISNLSNGGKMLYDSGYLYYTKYDGIIYKIPVNGGESSRVALFNTKDFSGGDDEVDLKGLNIQGLRLYFYWENAGICSIGTDGSSFSVLREMSEFPEISGLAPAEMIVIDGYIFLRFQWTENEEKMGHLYQVSMKDLAAKQLMPDGDICCALTVYDGFVYYSCRGKNSDDWGASIVRIRPDGTGQTTLQKDANVSYFSINDDYVYVIEVHSPDICVPGRAAHKNGLKLDWSTYKRCEYARLTIADNHFGINSKAIYCFHSGFSGGIGIVVYMFQDFIHSKFALLYGLNRDFGLYMVGNWVYYITEDGALGRMSSDGTGKESLNL